MIKTYVTSKDGGFEWIDMVSPERADIQKVAEKLGLHEASVEDALQPDHLPKFEKLKNYNFAIIRIYAVARESEADTVQELTNKVAIFYSNTFLVTVHKHGWKQLDAIDDEFVKKGECLNSFHLFNEIIRQGLMTFDAPGAKLNRTIDYLEEQVFLKGRKSPLLQSMYFLKRKVDVIRRILLLTYDVIDHIDPTNDSNEYTRDIRDLYVKQQSIFDSLSENTNHLLGIYFNISAQRTNETIRILTIFSVFFMPLTFVVGVYGMNFQYMPELREKWGYPGVMILMLLIVIGIYIWFKRKHWL
jgi:magnesium transporter